MRIVIFKSRMHAIGGMCSGWLRSLDKPRQLHGA